MIAYRQYQHKLRRQKQEQARLRQEEEDRLRLFAEEEARVRHEREVALRREAEQREMMLRREAEEEESRLRREAEDRERALRDAEQAERDAREREEAARQRHADQVRKAIPIFIQFQSLARASLVQQRLSQHIATLRYSESFVTKLQAAIRRKLVQDSYDALRQNFRRVDVVRSLGGISQLARAALVKKRIENNKKELGFVEPDVVGVQSQIRGVLARWKVDEMSSRLNDEVAAVRLQSLWRGVLAKHRYWDELDHYRRNLDKIVRLQALVRSRKTQNQYQQLRLGKNVPVSTIKNFVNLLDDSEFDYREELEVERLKLELVRLIREAQGLEDDVKDLDIKIALLVKNTITYEVARSERARTGGMAALQRGDVLASAKDPFAPSNLDAQTQRKFELYQQLFWHLQATPEYLARLFANVGKLGMSEKMQKAVEATTFLVFGFAQNSREEYLLLKLFRVGRTDFHQVRILMFLVFLAAVDPGRTRLLAECRSVRSRSIHLHSTHRAVRTRSKGEEVSQVDARSPSRSDSRQDRNGFDSGSRLRAFAFLLAIHAILTGVRERRFIMRVSMRRKRRLDERRIER